MAVLNPPKYYNNSVDADYPILDNLSRLGISIVNYSLNEVGSYGYGTHNYQIRIDGHISLNKLKEF